MRKRFTKMTKTVLSFALAAAMVMGLSGTTTLAAADDQGSAASGAEAVQTICVVQQVENGTADVSFPYHLCQVILADYPIEDIANTISEAAAGLSYTIYDTETDAVLGTDTTDETGGFSLRDGEYAEFLVPAETDWYVYQDTPEDHPLSAEEPVKAEGDHAFVVEDVFGVVQYESEEEPTPTTSVDKTALEAEIEKAEALDESDYTAESWEALQEALENAKAVFEDPDATQEEVDEALDELEKAREDLEKKDDGSTPVPDTVNITGTKTWDDNDNQDGLRPENITVNLLADDEVVESAAVAEGADGSWTYAFEAMPKYDESGEEITYTVTEDEIAYYETSIDGYDITNTHEPFTGSVIIKKEWDDNDDQDGVRPESVTVGIFAGNTYVDSKEITEADGWTCTFDDLPLYEDGEELEYTVYEEDVEGYTGTVDWNEDSGIVTFTNSYTPEETNVTVRKVWEDAGDQDGLRPENVTVSLLADGQPVLDEENEPITGELNEDNDWSYDFTGLDKYADGVEIAYTVTEDEVAGYTAEDPIRIEGTNTFILVNTHEPALYNGDGDLTVTKKWNDGDDADGVRPDVIRVTVKADDEVVRQEYVTEVEDWTCTFTALPQYENGQELTYTVEETLPASVPEDAYTSAITEADGVVTITNTHEPSPEPTVDKDALQKEYDEDSQLNEDDYTSDSWAPFEEALDKAADVLADPDASQEVVDEALEELKDAKANLQEKVAPAIEDVTITATGLDEDNTKSYDGKEVTLTVTAETSPEGAETTYTWYKDGTIIDGATGAELTLAGNISDSGTYTCVVTVTNDGIEATGSAEITITIHADYSDLDEEIVPEENDPSTWEDTESVSAYSPVEIEMSTALPHMDGAELSAGGYSIVFHDELASGLTLDEKAAAFTVTIGGETINSKYYTITLADGTNPLQIMPYAITLAAPAITDSCAFHVEVDLTALYNDKVIGDGSLTGETELMLFFYADLEGDALAGSYTSTAWYEVYSSESVEALFTSPQHVITVTTYEIEITKYDASQTEESALAGATFGIYSDADCTNAVTLKGEAYTAITGEDGTAAFYGLAEGTYYIKEITAPSGYSLSDAVLPVDLTSLDEGTYVYSGKFANVPIATYSVMTEYMNLTGTGKTGENAATAGENYITTLTADEGYVLPESVEVTIGENAASAGTDYEYSRETGELTIYGTSITGDIVITAAAAGPEAFAVYCATDTSLTFYMDTEVPNDGGTYKDKAATNVYTGLESLDVEDITNNQSSIPWSAIVADVTNVVIDESFADARPINLTYWFYGFKNASFTGLANINTSNVTKMAYLFNKCSGITELDLSTWDTSNVTTMRSMFSECTALQTVDVSKFDTSNVASMYYMFYSCKALTKVDVSNFDTSNVTTMYYMFYYCSSLKKLDVSNFDTSNVTTMYDMFEYCTSLEELDVSNWNTEKCTSLHAVFGYCSALTTLDVSAWNTENVTDMGSAFRNCESLTSLDLGSWNTAKVSNSNSNYISDFATGCTALDWIKIGDAFDLFTKSEDALVSQQNWYDSDTNGNLMSDNYMIGVSNATSGNTSGQYWTHTTQVAEPVVKYAVKIWGIGADTYQDEDDGIIKTAGLTFGPATGDNEDGTGTGYITSHKAHLTQEEYESKEKGVCIHWMTWDEIIEQSKEDPDVFQDCMENGCTKAVELTPNETLFNMTTVSRYMSNSSYTGDGVSTLFYLLNGTGSSSYTYAAIWNYTYTDNSSSDPANIYSRSRIRTTLTGDRSNIDEWLTDNPGANDYYGYDTLCDTSDCLLSCFPSNLQEAMVPRTTSNTGNATSGTSANDKTSYDKLFLFSLKEIGISSSSDDAGGDDYGINSSASDRVAYEFSGTDAAASLSHNWWTRSRYSSDNHEACDMYDGGNFLFNSVAGYSGLSPGFCLAGPEETEPEAFAVYSDEDSSLTFYYGTAPSGGDTYKDKAATAVYTGLETLNAESNEDIPWNDLAETVTSVVVDTSFKDAKPINLAGWFYGFKNASFTGFENMDTSEVKSMQYTFYDCEKLDTLNVSEWNTSNLESLYGTFSYCSSLTTLDVSEWVTSQVTDMTDLFYNCTSLTSLGEDGVSNWNTESLTSLYDTFGYCTSLTELDVSCWNTENVTTMRDAFYNCDALQSLDLSQWKTGNVTTMYGMFWNCKALKSVGDVSEWDTSNVENMYCMFYNCFSLEEVNVASWNTEKVTNMGFMFNTCTSLKNLDLSGWNTSNVTTITNYLNFALNLGEDFEWIKIGDNFDLFSKSSIRLVSQQNWYDSDVNGKTMSENYMIGVTNENTGNTEGQYWTYTTVAAEPEAFAVYCADDNSLTFYMDTDVPTDGGTYKDKEATKVYTGLETLDPSGTADIPWTSVREAVESVVIDESFAEAKPINLAGWFYGFTNASFSGFENLNTSEVKSMQYTFYDCEKLTTLDVSGWDTSNLISLYGTFAFCTSLTTLDVSKWDTSHVTTMAYLFRNCTSLATLDVSGWTTSYVTDMGYLFFNCTNLDGLEASNWDTSSLTSLYATFYECAKLTTLDVSKWNTSNLTDLYFTFYDCYVLTDLNVSNWDMEKVTTMQNAFTDCDALTSLDLSGWNTANVTSMQQMFWGCDALTSVGDLSEWNTANMEDMHAAFYDCSSLEEVNVADWNTEKVTDMSYTFRGCSALSNLDLSGWDTSNVTTYDYFAYLLGDDFDWIKIGDNFDLFAKSTSRLVSQKNWYDSDINGKTMSENYMIGVSNENTGNTSGQYWTHTTQVAEPAVKYAVKIWGIGADTYQDEDDGTIKTAGLTFGPATGDNEDGTGTGYITSYKAHLTQEEYESKEKGVCIHWMTWDEIIEQSKEDPDVFQNCLENGCTKAVELTPNEKLFNQTTVNNVLANNYSGDGVSTLYYLLNGTGSSSYTYGAIWNYSYASNSSSDPANIYSRSRIRTTLTGDRSNIDEWLTDNPGANDYYGYDTLCDTSDCLLSCFPSNLQEAMVPRTTSNTGNATSGTSANDKTSYDKLFLFSLKEIGISSSSDDAGGDDYGINSSASDRVAYEFSGIDAMASSSPYWWTRSRNVSTNGSAYGVYDSGGFGYINVSRSYGLSPGFCLPGPEETEPEAFAVYSKGDSSLTFYMDTEVPTAGDTYKDKEATYVYTDVDTLDPSGTADIPWTDVREDVKSVVVDASFKDAKPINLAGWFYGFTNASFTGFENMDTSEVRSMQYTFYDCEKLETLNVSDWDTSNLRSLHGTFDTCISLTTLDVSKWNTENVNTLYDTFADCVSLTTLDVSKWDTSNVTNMMYLFYDCTSLTTLDVSNWKTSNVTTMAYLFFNCTNLTSLDVSGWNTSSNTSLFATFYECAKLTTLDVSKWNTSNLTDLYFTFYDCYVLTDLDVSNWDMEKVTTMQNAFTDCDALTSLDLSGWNTANVTSMQQMFWGCDALTSVGDLSEWNTANMADLNTAFYSCHSLAELNVAGWDTSSVTDMGHMFTYCSGLANLDISGWDTSKVTEYTSFATGLGDDFDWIRIGDDFDLFTKSTSRLVSQQNWYDSDEDGNLMSGNYMIGVTNAISGNESGQYWTHTTTSKVGAFAVYSSGDYSLTFYYGTAPSAGDTYKDKAATAVYTDVDSLSVSDYSDIPWYSSYGTRIRSVVFDKSFASAQPVSLAYWFSHCSALTSVEGFKNVDTSKVTSVKNTFGNCTSLTGIDVSTDYDTSALTDMYGMFYYCTKLESVAGLPTWDTSAVTTMAYMFYTAGDGNPLTSVGDLSGWKTSNVTAMQYMFGGSVNLTSVGDLSKWDLSSATNISYMFYNCKSMESIEGLAEWNTENVTTIAGFFNNCSALTSVDGISKWKTVNVTSMTSLFSGCSALADVGDISGWNTEKVTSMSSMFNGCESLESLDISGWNTAAVTDMRNVFDGCASLESLDISGWNTGKVSSNYAGFATTGEDSALEWIKIGDNFDLFTKSADALVSQKYWYDSEEDGNLMSDNYMIGVSGAGQYWTHTTQVAEPAVKYAVKIWGIGADTYQDENDGTIKTAGLTFGPATGDNEDGTGTGYITSYKAHLTQEEYESKEKGVCIHWMTWGEIIEQSKEDPDVFQDCLENGCTKAVELTPNETLFNMTTVDNYVGNESYTGDGVSTLYYLLNGTGSATYSNSATWNYSYEGNSSSDRANIYSRSRIRTTLTGDRSNIDEWLTDNPGANDYYGYDTLCDTSNCLLSCFPSNLQEAIVPRTTKNTGNATSGTSANDKTTYDKLFLFSVKETGLANSSDDAGGDDYGINSDDSDRVAYEFSNADATDLVDRAWWSRSRYSSSAGMALYVRKSGSCANSYIDDAYGLSPGFCIE